MLWNICHSRHHVIEFERTMLWNSWILLTQRNARCEKTIQHQTGCRMRTMLWGWRFLLVWWEQHFDLFQLARHLLWKQTPPQHRCCQLRNTQALKRQRFFLCCRFLESILSTFDLELVQGWWRERTKAWRSSEVTSTPIWDLELEWNKLASVTTHSNCRGEWMTHWLLEQKLIALNTMYKKIPQKQATEKQVDYVHSWSRSERHDTHVEWSQKWNGEIRDSGENKKEALAQWSDFKRNWRQKKKWNSGRKNNEARGSSWFLKTIPRQWKSR